MSNQTWQKACDCRGTTATSGRMTVKDRKSEHLPFDVAYHPGPVCDSCDTPWKLVPVDTSPPARVT